jgi:transcriptional regulator with XRE-family HTH domain
VSGPDYVVLNREGVRRIMARRNVSNEQVARMLKTTANYWSQLLNHHRRPSPKLRSKIMGLAVFRGRGITWETIFELEVGDV